MLKKIHLDQNIYAPEIIQQGIEDFSEITKILFDGDNISIEMDQESDIDECFNEFMNYCIWLINA